MKVIDVFKCFLRKFRVIEIRFLDFLFYKVILAVYEIRKVIFYTCCYKYYLKV